MNVSSLQTYSLALLVLLGCKGGGGSDLSECVSSTQCEGDAQCFALTSGAGVCLSPCEGTEPTCIDGEACASIDAGGFACLPGGDLGQGETCTRSIDCGLGLLCIDTSPDTVDVCRIVCAPGADTCTAGATCIAIDANRGYCGAPVSQPDIGVASDSGA